MKHEIECTVTGKVQMVMFRDFAQRKARGLWITGTVQNKPDGTVHIVAQGTEEHLNRFLEHIHKGPFLARVGNVTVTWRDPKQEFTDFIIVY